MRRILLVTLISAIIIVNTLAYLVEVYGDVPIAPMFRFALIVGIMFITAIFAGAAALLGFFEKEEPNNDSSRSQNPRR